MLESDPETAEKVNASEPHPKKWSGFFLRLMKSIQAYFFASPTLGGEPQESIIEDRLSGFFTEMQLDKEMHKPQYDWKTHSLIADPSNDASINDLNEKPEKGLVLYDPGGRDLGRLDDGSLAPTPNLEDDYLYREWMGLTRRLPILPDRSADQENPQSDPEPRQFFSFQVTPEVPEEQSEPENSTERSSPFIFASDRTPNSALEMRDLLLDTIEDDGDESDEGGNSREHKDSRRDGGWGTLEILLTIFTILLIAGIAFVFIYSRNKPAVPVATDIAPTPVLLESTPTSIITQEVPPESIALQATRSGVEVFPVEILVSPDVSFKLSMSTIVNGEWKPNGPEWLDGTEVNRIVTIPWSPDLEKLVTSLKPGDPIKVVFNNQGQITYIIQLIDKVPVGQSGLFDASQPSLLVILYAQDSLERWVITSYPESK
jgi:hypothetical protein